MKDINSFTCTCFCVADPEVREVGGTTLASTRVGINRMKDGEVDWFFMKVWGKPANTFGQYVKKGTQLAISGRVQIETNGDRIYPTIYVEDFKFINSGGKKKEQQEREPVEDEVVNDVTVPDDGGVGEDDIPF